MVYSSNGKPAVVYGSGEATELLDKIYSAEGTAEELVSFGYGKLETVLGKIGKADGLLAFGIDETGKAVIVANGQLASSKILDINVEDASALGKSITVSYVDPDSKDVKTTTFEAVAADDLDGLDERIDVLEKVELVSADKTVKVISSEKKVGDVSTLSYDFSVNVDGVTIKKDESTGVLSTVANTYALAEADEASEGMLKTYVLKQTTADGTSTEVGKIDLPKDYLIKDVHLCKVAEDGSCVKQGEAGFAAATGDLAFHFEWNTKDSAEGAAAISKQIIKVKDFVPVYTGDNEYISVENQKVTFDSSQFVSDNSADVTYTKADDENAAALTADSEDKFLTGAAIKDIKDYVDDVVAANQEGITVADDSSSFIEVDADDDHKVAIKTSELGDVNIVKDASENEWEVVENEDAPTGLATAADVAKEIIANAKVVADALNAHQEKLDELDSSVVKAVEVAEDSSVYVSTEVEDNTVTLSVNVADDSSAIDSNTAALATAKGVKEYVESSKLRWINLD